MGSRLVIIRMGGGQWKVTMGLSSVHSPRCLVNLNHLKESSCCSISCFWNCPQANALPAATTRKRSRRWVKTTSHCSRTHWASLRSALMHPRSVILRNAARRRGSARRTIFTTKPNRDTSPCLTKSLTWVSFPSGDRWQCVFKVRVGTGQYLYKNIRAFESTRISTYD